jgi:hypothetical protein
MCCLCEIYDFVIPVIVISCSQYYNLCVLNEYYRDRAFSEFRTCIIITFPYGSHKFAVTRPVLA